MPTIKIQVQDKIATNLTPEVKIVCGNGDYKVEFQFDEQWSSVNFKTGLFIFNGDLIAHPFDGNVCPMPIIENTTLLAIGVKSSDGLFYTTTPAYADCLKSASDLANNKIPAPTKDVYDEIIALLNKYIGQGGGGEPIDLSTYQPKVDENLQTKSKEIVGAINELHNREDKQGLTEEQVQAIVDKSELNTRKQLVLGAEGVAEERVYSFTVENSKDFLEYRTNLTKFLVDLNLPIVGDLDTKKEVAITFGDTTYYVHNILKGMEHATIGDLQQVDKYNNETGYRFITEMTFFQTTDIVGFAIIPTISISDILALDSDEMDNYTADGGLTQGQLAVCKRVITNGYTEGAVYRFKITYPNIYEWEELTSGKIVDSDTITVMADGKAVSLHLNADLVSNIQRALKIPMSTPTLTELVGVDTTKSQVGISIDDVVKVGVTTNTKTLTDEEKASACNWLGAVKQIKYNKNYTPPTGNDGVYWGLLYARRFDDTETAYPIATQSSYYSIPIREHNGNFYIGNPTHELHCTNKRYVDGLIAELVARIEKLEAK